MYFSLVKSDTSLFTLLSGVKTKYPQQQSLKLFNWSCFQAEGADVRVFGSNWDSANSEAVRFVQNDPGAFLVHPFDQPTRSVLEMGMGGGRC